MNYHIDIDNKNKVVLCTCSGVLDVTSTTLMTRDVRKRAFDLGYVSLYDVTNVTLDVGIIDAYSFPRDIKKIYEKSQHRFGKAAVVYKNDVNFWKFFESTSRDTGLDVLVFDDIEQALKWLSE